MEWTPFSEAELREEIEQGVAKMSAPQRWLWKAIKIPPQKWRLPPWGDRGGGFWVVAILGEAVLWYNDIEEGFNRSSYSEFGLIGEYWCNQDELQWTVQHLLDSVETGRESGARAGPPEPLE